MRIEDPWLAYQLDAAVSLLGNAVESALLEKVEITEGKTRPKYTLEQLLSDRFRLPREEIGDGLGELQGVAGLVFDEVR